MEFAFNRAKPNSWVPWPIGDDRPLFLGESFFANGHPPAAARSDHRRAGVPRPRRREEPGVYKVRPDVGGGIPLARHRGIPLLVQLDDGQGGSTTRRFGVRVREGVERYRWIRRQKVVRHLKVFNDTLAGRSDPQLIGSFRHVVPG